MRGWADICAKEVLHILRDPTSLVFALMIPLIQLMIFGYAINLDVRNMATAVVDQDRSRESSELVDRLRATGFLEVVRYADSADDASALLRAGEAKVAVIIPPDFARQRLAGRKAQVGVLIDGSDSTIALRARSAFVGPSQANLIEPRVSVLFNPTMRTETFMVPGLIAVVLQIVSVALTALSLVRERENGTLEQLMVTPVGRLGLMAGKLIPYAVLAFLEMSLVLAAGYLLFDVRVAGSLALLLVLSAPFIVATLGMGLLISTIAKTQAQAFQLTLLFMLPSILMSGFAFPRETQPGILYLISGALPVTHFLNVVRGIVVRGAGFGDIWTSVVALILIAAVCVALSVTRFRKSLA